MSGLNTEHIKKIPLVPLILVLKSFILRHPVYRILSFQNCRRNHRSLVSSSQSEWSGQYEISLG